MRPCPYRIDVGTLGTASVVGCRLINAALGWPAGGAFPRGVCDRCQASTDDPQPPVIGSDSVVTAQFKRLLRLPLMSQKQGDEYRATYGDDDREVVGRRCDLFGVARAEPKPPPTRAQQKEQEARKRIKKAARDANREAQRAFKADPCVHFSMPAKLIETAGCDCGPLYHCNLFDGDCVVSLNDKNGRLRSCLKCPKRESKSPRINGRRDVPAVPGPLDVAILVTTSPIMRPKGPEGVVKGWRDTLPKTLASIEAAGWSRKAVTIFAEPDSRAEKNSRHWRWGRFVEIEDKDEEWFRPLGIGELNNWRVVQREQRHQPWHNIREGLRQLLAERPDCQYFMLVEDDTWLAKDLRKLLDARGWPSPRCGILRVFRMRGRKGSNDRWVSADKLCEPKQANGYQKVFHNTTLFGSNAVILTRKAVEKLLADPGAERGEWNGKTYVYSPDVFMGLVLHRWGFEEWCCNPSLAQTDTVNNESTIGNTFLGSDLMMADHWEPDASRLLPPQPLPKQTTVFLISRNRLTCLKQLAEQCAKLPGADVRIVDNCSTWEPLVDWLRDCQFQVTKSPTNLGKKAPWELGLVQQATERCVVSDPDLDIAGVPADVLDVLRGSLDEFPWANAAGLSLEIEGLPNNDFTAKVRAWEAKFWTRPLGNAWFKALVDTTFAMRRRGEPPSWGNSPSVRANRPYVAQHLPWHVTMEEWTDEDRFYYQHCTTLGSGSLTRKHVLPLLQGAAG